MNKLEELAYMRNSLRQSVIAQGVVWTPVRERMADRELTIVRILGGYAKGSSIPVPSMRDANSPDMSARSVCYQTRNINIPTQTCAIDIANNGTPTGCYLLPEAMGADGLIHIQAEHGMNLGVVIARAKSPLLREQYHTTRELSFLNSSMVNDEKFIYGENYDLGISGENYFVDVIPGRVELKESFIHKPGAWGAYTTERHINIHGITPCIADKNRKNTSRKADMVLEFVGAELPANEEPEYNQFQTQKLEASFANSRGISFGIKVHTDIRLMEDSDFKPSKNILDHYILGFMID